MLQNATLLRLDSASGFSPGRPRRDRCALTPPTATELQWLRDANLSAAMTLYLPLTDAPEQTVVIVVGDHVLLRLDGQEATLWRAVDVSQHVGGVLRFTRAFLVVQE